MIQKGRSRKLIERQGKQQEIKQGTGGRSSIAGEIQEGRFRQLGERDTWEGAGDQVLDRKEEKYEQI